MAEPVAPRGRTWPPTLPDGGSRADVGVIGGSGFYEFLDDTTEVVVSTPYGAPSGPVTLGMVGGRRVAFLARHGRHHTIPPAAVNYRANVYALHQLGVRAVIGPCSVGSLQPHLHPGDVVVVDQLVDRTWGRGDTYFDGVDGVVDHVSFAEPYDATLRRLAVEAARLEGVAVHDGGTVVVINGPRFSTRAESRCFSSQGWSVVNMTQYPESVLAAELRLPYVGLSLVTDYDAGLEGVDGIAPVTMEAVFAMLKANIERVRAVLFRLIPLIA